MLSEHMISFIHWPLIVGYLVSVFALGAIWHLVAFKKLYDYFGNFDKLHKPRFEFGILSMLMQGVAFGFLFDQVVQNHITGYEFMLVIFLTLWSFIAFAELGKHKVNNIGLFLVVQTGYCIFQTILVYFVFNLLSS